MYNFYYNMLDEAMLFDGKAIYTLKCTNYTTNYTKNANDPLKSANCSVPIAI